MAVWEDIAKWVGPTVNHSTGGMSIRYVVLHIQQGNQQGSIAWCLDNASGVSAHFFVSKLGEVAQMVDTDDKAWAQGTGNAYSISVECEGNTGDILDQAQIVAVGKILARAHQAYGVPLQLTDDPNEGSGLGWHGMGGAMWGNHPDCPGDPIIQQRPAILAAAIASLGSQLLPAYPGVQLRLGSTGSNVVTVQRRLLDLGYWVGPAGADGRFGPQTATTVGTFQLDKHVGGSIKADGTPDEIVGPRTWLALWRAA